MQTRALRLASSPLIFKLPRPAALGALVALSILLWLGLTCFAMALH